MATVLSGKIAAGIRKTEQSDDDKHRYVSAEDDKGSFPWRIWSLP